MNAFRGVRWTVRAYRIAGYAGTVLYTTVMFAAMCALMQLCTGRGGA